MEKLLDIVFDQKQMSLFSPWQELMHHIAVEVWGEEYFTKILFFY